MPVLLSTFGNSTIPNDVAADLLSTLVHRHSSSKQVLYLPVNGADSIAMQSVRNGDEEWTPQLVICLLMVVLVYTNKQGEGSSILQFWENDGTPITTYNRTWGADLEAWLTNYSPSRIGLVTKHRSDVVHEDAYGQRSNGGLESLVDVLGFVSSSDVTAKRFSLTDSLTHRQTDCLFDCFYSSL